MELSNQNILFLTRTMDLGGTENVILQLCEIFKPHVNKIVVCSKAGVNVEKLNDMGIEHYDIDDIASKNPVLMLKNYIKIKKIVKYEKITVIHSHHRMAALYAQLIAKHNIVKIANAHNTFYDKKFLTSISYRNTQLIAVGEMVKNNLVDFFKIKERMITVIHNAVKPFEGNIVQDELINSLHKKGFFVVGNIGRLSEQKGMEYYIKSIPIIIKKYPYTRFVIAGTGENKEELIQLAKNEGIQDYIYFLGYRDDVQNLMSQIDLVVLSSLWEGLPLTPIEAYSVGRTIVATAVDGTTEIVDDGIDGYLVEPKKEKAIAKKVCYLIENPDVLQKMQECASKKYKKEFSFESLENSYINFYKEIRNG